MLDGIEQRDGLDPTDDSDDGEELCDNRADDDGDGLTDCSDARCATSALCVELCDDGIDNDSDGLVDCEDSFCIADPSCVEDCEDGIDNNNNGLVDCQDEFCWALPACPMSLRLASGTADSFTRQNHWAGWQQANPFRSWNTSEFQMQNVDFELGRSSSAIFCTVSMPNFRLRWWRGSYYGSIQLYYTAASAFRNAAAAGGCEADHIDSAMRVMSNTRPRPNGVFLDPTPLWTSVRTLRSMQSTSTTRVGGLYQYTHWVGDRTSVYDVVLNPAGWVEVPAP